MVRFLLLSLVVLTFVLSTMTAVVDGFFVVPQPPTTTRPTTKVHASSNEASAEPALTAEETLKRLQELVGEHLSIDDLSRIKAESNFRNDLGADSLDVIELVLAVEQEFDITIEDDYASHIATIQDALDYLKKNHNIET